MFFTRNYVLLCVSNIFQFMLHFLLIATLPIYVGQDLGGADSDIGIMLSVFMLGAVVIRPFIGYWSDTHDQRRIVLGAAAVFFLAMLCYLVVEDIGLFFALRVLHGISFGALTTAALAAGSSTVPIEKTGEGIGYFSMFMTSGIVFGPLIGLSIIETHTFTELFLVCGVLSAATVLLAAGLRPCYARGGGKKQPLSIKGLIEKKTVPIGLIGACPTLAFSGVTAFITLFAQQLGLLPYAAYYFLASAITILISRPFVGRLFDRKNPDYLIYPAVVLMVAGLIILALATEGWHIIVSGIITALGNGTLFSCMQSLAIRNAPLGRTGAATSTYFILFDLGTAAGSFALGIVAQITGYVLLYLITAGIASCTGIGYFLWRRKTPVC